MKSVFETMESTDNLIINTTDAFNNVLAEDEHDLSVYASIGVSIEQFRQIYLPFHGWISVFVCLFGIIANILNIIVLTRSVMMCHSSPHRHPCIQLFSDLIILNFPCFDRKEMISPTNAILTGLAGKSLTTLLLYSGMARYLNEI